MAPRRRVGGRIALTRVNVFGYTILRENEAGVLQKKVIRHLGKVQKASDLAYRGAKTLYRQISVLWWRDTRAVQIAAKLKEDYEASPTT